MDWPEITELNNITITPMYPPPNGEMKFATSQLTSVFGHYRFGRPQSEVKILPLPDNDAAGVRVIEEPTIYGGLLFNHFGHAIAESMHRLWPKFASESLSSAKVAFSPARGARIRPWLREALSLHGITEEQVFTIDEPLCFRRLFVGAQARQMGGPTLIAGYQSMLDKLLELRLPRAKRERQLYVSRLDYHHRSGSFYGESAVARELASRGFEIIYPERHSLTELVTMLRDARVAVFAEGSAIHALELCGSTVPDVLVISRRPKSLKIFGALLANICSRWGISDHVLFNAGLTENKKKHSGVVDLLAVMHDIQSFTGIPQNSDWTSQWAAEAIAEDCERLTRHALEEALKCGLARATELRSAIRQGVAGAARAGVGMEIEASLLQSRLPDE